MDSEQSGNLMARWRHGDEQAAAAMFERYADRLIGLARSRISRQVSRRVDPEDVVLSAYRSFFAGARAGRFELERGGDLWRLLVTMTLHKLYGQIKQNTRSRRDVRCEITADPKAWTMLETLLPTREPSPLDALTLTDQIEQLMGRLQPLQRRMLEMRLRGFSLVEIAEHTDRTERTVRRVLDQVKEWLQEAI
jgi:RNA polymerase sigma factor (sigma-70 family)